MATENPPPERDDEKPAPARKRRFVPTEDFLAAFAGVGHIDARRDTRRGRQRQNGAGLPQPADLIARPGPDLARLLGLTLGDFRRKCQALANAGS